MDKARILIADDDDLLASTLSWLLKEHGYEVAVVRGGVERVLEQVRAMHPDLLLLDVPTPEGDGGAVLQGLSGDEHWRDIPVLAMSQRAVEDASPQLLTLGATDVIAKPFHVRDLLTRVRVQLRARHELLNARSALRLTEVELKRAQTEAESRKQLVDILHEVTGDFSSEELYHILVRRVARALDISHCSLVLASPGDAVGVVAAAYETPGLRHLEIRLERYPEIRQALESRTPVLIEDVDASPLYSQLRHEWAAAGTLVPFRSVIALPFRLDGEQAGVIFLRTVQVEPALGPADVEFADTVVGAAVSAIRRAQAIESTQADKQRLEILARTDPLTQTHNRRALMERLTSELERARRYGLTLSLLMVDLDHFKLVNDTYGHPVGDEALRITARVLQREARTVDLVSRYGGEEFVVMLPETGEEGAVAVAERIRIRIAEQAILPGESYDKARVTVSIGVAAVPSERVTTPEDLLSLADEALYRAKAEGRNRVCT
jgi:two-component system cell cycle response regulator